ncbi:MAG TPA: ABC transporter permease [Chloroflexota bacterium]|nr:ABC transporter permease [Chloroflexota bacterium]
MSQQLVRRFVQLVPTVFVVATLVFIVFRIVPGDPATLMAGPEATAADRALIRHELGLDRPVYVQYVLFLRDVVRGDLGKSMYSGRPVVEEVLTHYPATLLLAVASLFIAVPIGLALGTIAAVYQRSPLDYGGMAFAVAGVSLPNFWLGLMLMILFAVQLRLLPSSGIGGLRYLILPAISLGLPGTAIIARLTRASLIDTLNRDYVRTARAKGLRDRVVVVRHALRNALIPTVTAIGLHFGYLLGGSVIIETLFSWPGMGYLLISAVRDRDYPVVEGAVLVFAFSFILINALVEVLYTYLDPRLGGSVPGS